MMIRMIVKVALLIIIIDNDIQEKFQKQENDVEAKFFYSSRSFVDWNLPSKFDDKDDDDFEREDCGV